MKIEKSLKIIYLRKNVHNFKLTKGTYDEINLPINMPLSANKNDTKGLK